MNAPKPAYPQIGAPVCTQGAGGFWNGRIVAVAELSPDLAKVTMKVPSACALQDLGSVAHAFCIIEHFGDGLSLCIWSTRWSNHFARVSVACEDSAVAALAALIDKHSELAALEAKGLWDLEALAESLALPRRLAPVLHIVGGTDHHAHS
jgi:hypothetical protein